MGAARQYSLASLHAWGCGYREAGREKVNPVGGRASTGLSPHTDSEWPSSLKSAPRPVRRLRTV